MKETQSNKGFETKNPKIQKILKTVELTEFHYKNCKLASH